MVYTLFEEKTSQSEVERELCLLWYPRNEERPSNNFPSFSQKLERKWVEQIDKFSAILRTALGSLH